MRLEATSALAELSRCDHVELILNRAGAQQAFPMRLSRVSRKSRRHENNLRALLRQAAIELWKTQIVTDAQSHRAETGVADDDCFTRSARVGLAQRNAVGQIDVKEMDLAG